MYEVVVLVERPLDERDAHTLADLYADVTDPTHLHVLLPADDAPSQVESLLNGLAESSGVPTPMTPPVSSDNILGTEVGDEPDHDDLQAEARAGLARTLSYLRELGLDVDGEVVPDEPLAALESIVADRGSEEVVVMTRTHVVAQFLHTDWGSVARRHLDVPVLHLLEHAED